MIIFLGKIKLQAILYTLNSEARRLLLIVSLMQVKISIGLEVNFISLTGTQLLVLHHPSSVAVLIYMRIKILLCK